MTNRWKLFSIAFGSVLSVWPLYAHHGTAASYDQKRVVKFEGTVVEFIWRNPHSSLFVAGKDESGKPVEYSIELGSPGQMVKLGYRRDTFKANDHIVVEAHPSFSNPASGECLTCRITVNGKVPGNPPAGTEPKGQ